MKRESQKIKILAKFLLVFLVFSTMISLLNWKLISFQLTSLIPYGFDLSGHFAIGKWYADNVFPSTWGWTNSWYFGMPFPQFYPPLFPILLAVLTKILPLSYDTLANTTLLLSIFLIPVLIYSLIKLLIKNELAGWYGALASVLLISSPTFNYYGSTLESVFVVGLASQTLGFVFFLSWLYFFMSFEKNRSSKILSVLFLFLLSITNIHLFEASLIILLAFILLSSGRFLKGKKLDFIKFDFGRAWWSLLAFFGAAFWYIPMLYFFNYSAGRPIGIGSKLHFFEISFIFFIFTAISLLIAFKRKEEKIFLLGLSSVLLTLPLFFSLDQLILKLPIHFYRFSSVFYLLSIILGSYILAKLMDAIASKNMKQIVYGGFIIVTILFFAPKMISTSDARLTKNYDQAKTIEMARYVGSLSGITNVDYDRTDNASSFNLNTEIAKYGGKTSYSVFRESTPTSLFAVPVRNNFSASSERIGIYSPIAENSYFQSQSIEARLLRAEFMGISNFLVHSPKIISELEQNPLVKLEKQFPGWRLFSFKNQIARVSFLDNLPAALLADFDTKIRKANDYSYVKFQEEALYQGQLEIIMAKPKSDKIDDLDNMEKYGALILSDYSYHDLQKAFEQISVYSKRRPVIVIASPDPLFEKLIGLGKPHKIFAFGRLNENDELGIDWQYREIFQILKKNKIPILSPRPKISYEIKDGEIIGSFEKMTEQLPILIKSSYFPTWSTANKERPLLAGPNFMMIYADTDFVLKFGKHWSYAFGFYITFIAGLIFMILIARAIFAPSYSVPKDDKT